MQLWSTCNACGEAMHIYQDFPEFQSNHPLCPDTPDRLQQMDREMQNAVAAEDWVLLDAIGERAMEYMRRPLKRVQAALVYSTWGWPVFPLRPGLKTPLTKNGFKDAVTEAGQIKKWWARSPEANIGIATGHAFDVIDVDLPDGITHWMELQESGLLEVHGWQHTPSGGFHVLVEPTGDGNLTGVKPGIDYRGMGGYIVAAPSDLVDNGEQTPGRYRWSMKPSPVIKPGLSVKAKGPVRHGTSSQG